ncbi:MAG: spore cortex-lytic protein [Ruminococcaceae bacterium]|nr:spore cortex-lytic protein [Oscillospiraceae bacterium]
MAELPFIPETITVHLGPPNSYAENVTVPFAQYIKNVASSEIYPTWNENAIRANIYAQISYALNRVYTEYYRSQNYDFDITNDTSVDQSFSKGRDIFENISQIVDEIFNSYIRRRGSIEPLFAQYCNGTTSVCDGLSQWGSQELAENGLTPFAILQNYYGNDIELVENTPVEGIEVSVPLRPLELGSSGNDVKLIQTRLNRISTNYPAIPKIANVNGFFGQTTDEAVRRFQEIFDLTPDGRVGKATWYKIQFIYNGIKQINSLGSEGISLNEISRQFPEVLGEGSNGDFVKIIQLLLDYVSVYEETVPLIAITGYYGPETTEAVRAFQSSYGLIPDGIMGEKTYSVLYDVYRGIIASIPPEIISESAAPYPGRELQLGDEGEDVRTIQEYLNYLSQTYPEIPYTEPTGVFGTDTLAAVSAFQNLFGITPSGIVGVLTWSSIAEIYTEVSLGNIVASGQFPGFDID